MKMKIFIFSAAMAAVVCFGVGCKKDNSAANFVGNYNGMLTYAGSAYPDTFKVTSGSSNQQVIMFDTQDSIYLTATVSGNNVTSVTGSYPAGGGNSVTTFTGHGSLAGNALSVTFYGAYTYNGSPYIDTAVFVGGK